MTKRFAFLVMFSSLMIAVLAISALANSAPAKKDTWVGMPEAYKNVRMKLAGSEATLGAATTSNPTEAQSLGFKASGIYSASPGMEIGWTTYDLQSNCRMNRQVAWNGNDSTLIHFVWMKSIDTGATDRGTGYETWNPNSGAEGALTNQGAGGGCDVHGFSGGARSGYVGLDVVPTPDNGGQAVIGNHYNPGATGWASNIWFDFASNTCFFGPGRRPLPDSTMKYGVDPTWIANNSFRFIWPQIELQIHGTDTVVHMFAHQTYDDAVDPVPTNAYVHYFRHLGTGGTALAPLWDYPPLLVDTVSAISQCIATSHTTGTMALVWAANTPDVTGGNESVMYGGMQGGLRDSLGSTQRTNDIYAWVSNDMGATFPTPKFNITDYDSATGGYLVTGDLNAIYDLSDNLHVIYCGRGPTVPVEGDIGDWGSPWSEVGVKNFSGGRLFHWDQVSDKKSVVKDFRWNWDQDTMPCDGGAWNDQWVVKPMLSECDGKLYAFFVQFQDMPNGIYDDCSEAYWEDEVWPANDAGWLGDGLANGELYVSVSDNDGHNWDVARDLTNTYTPHCVTYPGELGDDKPVCESDHYVSVSRFGMTTTHPTGYDVVPVVDPSDGYAGNKYIDLTFINDKFPGSCMQGFGHWTSNPYKWFRVPCVEPVTNPVLVYYPSKIGNPTYTHPGVQKDTTIYMENVGNSPLTISSIATPEVNGPPGWLEVNNPGPITISHLSSSIDSVFAQMNFGGIITHVPTVVTGYVVLNSNSLGGSVDSVEINLIVADTLMRPEAIDIRTTCLRLAITNAGSMGDAGASAWGGNGGYNMNYFDDCDDTLNVSGQDDHAGVYLYDASPFVAYIDEAGDTILNYGMYDATWLSENGFRPQVSPYADSTTSAVYQYANSGVFYSKDSSIALESEYFAPKDAEYCDFVVVIQKLYGHGTGKGVRPTFVGDFFDFDIPSDSGSENESGFNATEKMIYMWGEEYGTDSIAENDCVLANQRYGGVAYYGGYRLPYSNSGDIFPDPRAMWTELNATYVYPADGFKPGQMYSKIATTFGYSAWSPSFPDPDSVALDLHAVVVFDQFDLGCSSQDTLVFCKVLMSEYDGGLDSLLATKHRADAWIAAHNIFPLPSSPQSGRCCYGELKAPTCEEVTFAECQAHADMISWDEGLTCSTPCPTPPAPVPEDSLYMDNIDGYLPTDDPTGTSWHELKPNYGGSSEVTLWFDNGDGILSVCDSLRFTGRDSAFHVEWVGPTIVVTSLDEVDTMYFDLLELNDGTVNPHVDPIDKDKVEGSWWHEVYPNFCTVWRVMDMQGNFSNYLDSCDYLIIRSADDDHLDTVHVIDVKTDVILKGVLGGVCDCEPGYCNGDALLNIFDITYIISYLYLGGPPPIPYELCSGDPNNDCTCNIFDITYLISHLYLGGPPPVDCATWLANCGPPLRK